MNFPSIKDNPIMYIGLLIIIEQGIGQGTASLDGVIPAVWIPHVKAVCNLLAFIGNCIMTALAVPNMKAPLAAPVTKVLAWLIMPLALILLMGSPAGAQNRIGGPAGQALDKLGVRPIGGQGQGSNEATVSGGDRAQSLLDKPFQDLANFIGDDIDAAITLSTSIPALQDGNGQQCLMALRTFGDVIKAHPAPLSFKIATDLEAFRLKQAAINQLCDADACTVVFNDITQTVTALSPVPLPIPNLHDLCSKVPHIKMVAPVANVTPAAAPKP